MHGTVCATSAAAGSRAWRYSEDVAGVTPRGSVERPEVVDLCGIAGFLDTNRMATAEAAEAAARGMADAVAHRGPDDFGIFVDPAAGIGLGHRRLSIIDLSPLGHQPMHSADGRYVISYNGEVYNFAELRDELISLGHRFRGGSDTEVMLAAFREFGPERAVTRFVGMFAIALWDHAEATLRLICDRLGVKPLYWCRRGGVLLFGSELKALMAHPAWRGEIDVEAVAAFMRYSYVPGTATIFRDVHTLAPGTMLTVQAGAEPRIAPYWRLRERRSPRRAFADEREAAAELETILRDSVRARMVADVPLGAFLSGGVNFSTVVALMQAQSARKVKTFSIGFHESGYDEARYAKAVAGHLGTDHTELYVTPRQAMDAIPNLPNWFDEPFADSSQISDVFGLRHDASPRNRGAVRRRRRRTVCRLSALPYRRSRQLQEHRKVDQVLRVQTADGQLVIIVFVTGLEAARDESKGGGVLGEAELRGFVQDTQFLHGSLLGHDVAEGHAVIVSAGFHHHAPAVRRRSLPSAP